MSARMTYTNCADCHRPLRTRNQPNTEHPDAVLHHGRGMCTRCHWRNYRGTRRATIPSTCVDCDRPLRTRKTPNTAHPDAVVHHGQGRCKLCHNRNRYKATPRRKPPTRCIECDVPMRPFNTTVEQYPGTRHHAGRGRCHTCYQRARARAAGATSRRARCDVVDDFTFLVEQLGGERAPTMVGWTKRTRQRVADRLGMKVDSLDTALRRAARAA